MRNHAHAPAIELEGKPGNTKIHTWTTLLIKTTGVPSRETQADAPPQNNTHDGTPTGFVIGRCRRSHGTQESTRSARHSWAARRKPLGLGEQVLLMKSQRASNRMKRVLGIGIVGQLTSTHSPIECQMTPRTFAEQMRQARLKSPLLKREQALKQFAEVAAYLNRHNQQSKVTPSASRPKRQDA